MGIDPRRAYEMSAHNRLLSKPIDIHWLGWKSDTATLMKHGWQISADQDIMNRRMQFALQYKPEQNNYPHIRGISSLEEFQYEQYLHDEMHHNFRPAMPCFDMQFAHNLQIHMAGTMDSHFLPIDARPTMYTDFKIHQIEDFAHFKTVALPEDTHEIWLQRASLNEVLDIALSKQTGRQEEIRKNMMKRQAMEEYRANSTLAAELRIAV